ncbi:hypothetical protein HYH03_002312 [Edaphochlamys debaryana]|uniref:Uncharacterized protein n=1 Tax=Edaphochlamys debaryana TaxID=47281 RepID=A0A835YFM1_9CHLO|nr:hypothetical protein HYH03_002312 [Edaphochlamys debaryana]|eukprot:KAG2500031.1 hypothetical protein HYH03_002312 [Edaphochlamys debaryana]
MDKADPAGSADGASAYWERELQALPQAVDETAATSRGSVHEQGERWGVTVSSEKGYLIVARSHLDTSLSSAACYALCNHPGGGALIESRRMQSEREVLVTKPHYKELRLVQTTTARELFRTCLHRTHVLLVEDGRDPSCLRMTYQQLDSTFFDKFSGETSVRPLRDEASGREVGSRYEVTNYVLPKGCPSWIARAPVLGHYLKKATLHHVKRVMMEVKEAADKVTAYAAEHGVSEMAALEALCGPTGECEEAEEGKVRSFMFEPDGSDADSEDENEEEEEGEAELQSRSQEDRTEESGAGGEGADAEAGAAVRALVGLQVGGKTAESGGGEGKGKPQEECTGLNPTCSQGQGKALEVC